MPEYADILQNRKKHLEHIRHLENEHSQQIKKIKQAHCQELERQKCEYEQMLREKDDKIQSLQGIVRNSEKQKLLLTSSISVMFNQSSKNSISGIGSLKSSQTDENVGWKREDLALREISNKVNHAGNRIERMERSSSRHVIKPIKQPQIKILGGKFAKSRVY